MKKSIISVGIEKITKKEHVRGKIVFSPLLRYSIKNW